MASMRTPPEGRVRRRRPRETAEVMVIGSERMLDGADRRKLERPGLGIEGFPNSTRHSFKRAASAAWARKLAGRLLAVAAIAAVVGVTASVLGGRGGEDPSSAGDELAVRQAPPTGDRPARVDSRRPGKAKARGARAKSRLGGVSEREREASGPRTQGDRGDTAPASGPRSEGPGGETAPAATAAPVVESAPMAPVPPEPVATDDPGRAVVPASGAEVRQEFGP